MDSRHIVGLLLTITKLSVIIACSTSKYYLSVSEYHLIFAEDRILRNIDGHDCIRDCYRMSDYITCSVYDRKRHICSCMDRDVSPSGFSENQISVYIVHFKRPGNSFNS